MINKPKTSTNFITISKCRKGLIAHQALVTLGLAPHHLDTTEYKDITLNLNMIHSIQHNKDNKVIIILYTTNEYFIIVGEEGEDENTSNSYNAMKEFLYSYSYSV